MHSEAAVQRPESDIWRRARLRTVPREGRTLGGWSPGGVTSDTVRVFDHDPDLLDGIEPAAVEFLRRRMTVPRIWAEPGTWTPPCPTETDRWFGLLVLDGLLIRSMDVEGRPSLELIGSGDLLRPWHHDDFGMPVSTSWRILERTSFAVLDERLAQAISRWPTISAALLSRILARSHALSLHLAIAHVRRADDRLRMLLWHLADRWGRVTPDGIVVPLALNHDTLACLACIRRPTATTALQALMKSGEVARREDGTWLLLAEPPGLGAP